MTRPALRTAVVLCAVLLGQRDAAAQDTAAPAESLFEEGRKLLEAKKFPEACAKLAESERLDPAVGTLLNLGDCYEKMGKVATAWAIFRQAAAMATTAKQLSREKIARTRASLLEPTIPRLAITVPHAVPGLEVRRGGVLLGAAEWSAASPSAVAIDPGEYDVVVSAPGKKPWTTKVTLVADGSTTSIEVPALETETADFSERGSIAPPPASAASVEAVTVHDRNVQRGIAIALATVGAVSMIVSIPVGVRALSLNKDAAGECPTNSTCTSQGQSDSQSAVTLGTVSTVLLMGGAAVVIGGGVLYLTAPRPKTDGKTAVRLSPVVGPGSFGLAGSF